MCREGPLLLQKSKQVCRIVNACLLALSSTFCVSVLTRIQGNREQLDGRAGHKVETTELLRLLSVSVGVLIAPNCFLVFLLGAISSIS